MFLLQLLTVFLLQLACSCTKPSQGGLLCCVTALSKAAPTLPVALSLSIPSNGRRGGGAGRRHPHAVTRHAQLQQQQPPHAVNRQHATTRHHPGVVIKLEPPPPPTPPWAAQAVLWRTLHPHTAGDGRNQQQAATPPSAEACKITCTSIAGNLHFPAISSACGQQERTRPCSGPPCAFDLELDGTRLPLQQRSGSGCAPRAPLAPAPATAPASSFGLLMPPASHSRSPCAFESTPRSLARMVNNLPVPFYHQAELIRHRQLPGRQSFVPHTTSAPRLPYPNLSHKVK